MNRHHIELGPNVNKYSCINHYMQEGKVYTQDQLSKITGFKVGDRCLKEMVKRGLIIETQEGYQTTQTDLFTDSETPKTVRI